MCGIHPVETTYNGHEIPGYGNRGGWIILVDGLKHPVEIRYHGIFPVLSDRMVRGPVPEKGLQRDYFDRDGFSQLFIPVCDEPLSSVCCMNYHTLLHVIH
jgi:hypothetical protein